MFRSLLIALLILTLPLRSLAAGVLHVCEHAGQAPVASVSTDGCHQATASDTSAGAEYCECGDGCNLVSPGLAAEILTPQLLPAEASISAQSHARIPLIARAPPGKPPRA